MTWPLSPAETVFFAVALFVGYGVRGVAGFGSGVVAAPLMAFFLPLSTIAPLITFLGAFVSVRQAVRDWHSIAWKVLLEFVPGIVVGVPLGIWMFEAVRPELLIKALGGYVVLYALYSLFGARLRLGALRFPRWAAIPIGTLGAVIATLFGGMAGPVYVTYLDARRLPMRVFRVTVSTTLFALNLARSAGYLASGVFTLRDFTLVAGAVLPVYLGTLFGERIHERISATVFRRFIGGLLILSGVGLLLAQ